MPKPQKTARPKGAQRTTRKLLLYEIIYNMNDGFEQVSCQLQRLEKRQVGGVAWKKFRLIVEEARAEINFELVGLLGEWELKDWTHFGRLRQEREKKPSDRQDVMRPMDRPKKRLKKRGVVRSAET
jgi:hypothetical protein